MDDLILNFIFEGQILKMQCKKNECMKEIFKKYATKIGKQINNIYFLANGNKINEELKLEEIKDINNILVNEMKEEKQDKIIDNKKQSKDIICPICSESCIINFDEYKIILKQCDNKHEISNLLLNEFYDSQMINESKIVCHKCNKSKLEISYNQLYKCCDCNINICPICKLDHKDHIVIDYKLKNYLCNKHGEKYISYCKDCYKNLCDICLAAHKEHNLALLIEKITKKDLLNNLKELKIKLNNFKSEEEIN